MNAPTRVPHRALAVLLLLVTCAVSGCVALPSSGPVRLSPVAQQAGDQGFEFNPGGPKQGSSPAEVIEGFLVAMQATPATTFVARQFLTSDSASTWAPQHGTVVYTDETTKPTASGVTVRLSGITQLDERGSWLGDPSHGAGMRLHLALVKEGGQWRISNPPDLLIVPQSHFDTRFKQYFLYFFDTSAQVLVPEPVYLPGGAQTPTLLVAGLLRGPDPALQGVERSFIPAGTRLGDISVPVSRDGVADVPLTDNVLDVRDEDLPKVYAELAWTLAQVSGTTRMRVTVDGSPLELPGQTANVSLGAFSSYDPSVAWASQLLFGQRNGRVVTVSGSREQRVPGAFGSHDYGLRSLGVNLAGTRFAGVTADGGTVLVSGRSLAGTPHPTTVHTGTDVLDPTWDLYGQLWLLDRTADGARLVDVRKGAAHGVPAPGITGKDVRDMVISRDGTRLVAEERRGGHDVLVVARISRSQPGALPTVQRVRRLPLSGIDVQRIRDLAWRTPGSVAVLVGTPARTSQVVIVQVDGSSALSDTVADPGLFRDEATRLVTAPAPGVPLYVDTSSGSLFELAGNGRWIGTGIRPGLRSPTYVG